MKAIKPILLQTGCRLFVVLFATILMCFFTGPDTSRAAIFTVDDPSDLYNPVGDFIVAGNLEASSPGVVYDVLQLQNNGQESGSNLDSSPINGPITMGNLWTTLNAGGITSSSILVFGFGLNETGSVGSNSVDIQNLEMSFELPGGGSQDYFLDTPEDNTVTVVNYNQGQNTAEAQFQVNLGFDFMSTYNAGSQEEFFIQSTIDNTSDGFEVYFLSSGFTSNPPVPIPGAVWLLGSGLIGIIGLRRKFKK